MVPTRLWVEGMEQASPDRGVDGQIAIVTFTDKQIAQGFRTSREFLLIATTHDRSE